MALSRPRLFWQVAFNANPNDRFAVPLWTDLSHMYKRLEGPYASGSQYELAKAQASQPSIRWFDPNEYLNPANTAGLYAPNVLPLRRLLGQAVHPADSVGNLLNANAWRPNDADPYDPSFESYANGAALPDWIAAVGGITGSVTTTNPQQGTKSATYAVTAVATPQGLTCTGDNGLPCVPGQQYTASAYVRQSSASTQWLLVGDQTLAWSAFSGSATNGWATANLGGSWTSTGGSASDFSESGGKGRHSIGTLNVRRYSTISSGIADVDTTVTFAAPAVITGGASDSVRAGVVGRYTDASNSYRAEASLDLNGVVTLRVTRRSAATDTQLGSSIVKTFSYTAGTEISVRLQINESAIRARCWLAGRMEPDIWDINTTDTALSSAGAVGATTFATSGVTNTLPLVIAFDDFMTAGSTASSTTTTTGSYVRLSVTFTATQPRHTLSIRTRGTASAGTVNIDAIQHEIGSSATAFVTTGAMISPFLDGYIERWTREYEDQGFTGYAITPVIDSLAVASSMGLDAEYPVAVMSLEPRYFWRLDDGQGAAIGLESSGNQGAVLEFYSSKYGPGVLPEFGSAIDIVGATGQTGVKFTPFDPPTSSTGEFTFLSLGRTRPGVQFPRAYGTTWGASVAAWVKLTPTSPATTQGIFAPLVRLGEFSSSPIYISADASGVAVANTIGGVITVVVGTTDILNDQPHLIVGTITQVTGGNTTISIYVDGVLEDTTVVATSSPHTVPANVVNVGALSPFGNMANGTIVYAALWERELSASEVTALWTAGGLGYNGEVTGARLTRRLRGNGYGGKLRISTGSSTMQPVTTQDASGLDEVHNVTNVEGGCSWSARDGALVFEGRQQRWLRLTPRGIFGEDTAAGEIPYLEGVQFDLDPTFTFANVKVSRVNGTTAFGGTIDARILTARKYFPRSSPEDSGDYETDELAQYKADWVFNTHKESLLRVSVITLDPASNSALWPAVLNLEVGQRWTVKRRAKAANAGAGITMSGDYFIEQITFYGVNMDTDQWLVAMFLSPIGSAIQAPGVTFQPWILGDATYGVLGSTTVLGW